MLTVSSRNGQVIEPRFTGLRRAAVLSRAFTPGNVTAESSFSALFHGASRCCGFSLTTFFGRLSMGRSPRPGRNRLPRKNTSQHPLTPRMRRINHHCDVSPSAATYRVPSPYPQTRLKLNMSRPLAPISHRHAMYRRSLRRIPTAGAGGSPAKSDAPRDQSRFMAFVLDVFDARSELLREPHRIPSKNDEHPIDDNVGEVFFQTPADQNGKLIVQRDQAPVKGFVVERTEAETIAGIHSKIGPNCPRDNMAGDQERTTGQIANAAAMAIRSQHGRTEKCLAQTYPEHSFGFCSTSTKRNSCFEISPGQAGIFNFCDKLFSPLSS